MTMTRTEKATHQLELHIATQNSGYVTEEYAKPSLRRAAIETTGHAMMPASEYRVLRMGRRVSPWGRRDVVVGKLRARRAR